MHQRFIDAINANPDDRATQLIYADWLDQQGDPRSEAWRVLIEEGKRPEKCLSNYPGLADWRWYQSRIAGLSAKIDLRWIEANEDVYLDLHRTFFSAMDAACVAWVRCHRDPEFLMEGEPGLSYPV